MRHRKRLIASDLREEQGRPTVSYRIGSLKGRRVLTYKDAEGKRIRIRLDSEAIEDAVIEGHRLYTEYWDSINKGHEWTIEEIWREYRSSLTGRPSAKSMRYEEASIVPYFGRFYPREITEELVENYIYQRRSQKTGEPVKPGTLWTELGRLRDAISYAKKKRWITPHDVPYIPRPSKPEPRDRWLNEKEIVRLLTAASAQPHLHLAIHLMLATAGRVTAVLELTWDRVNFKESWIDLRTKDTGTKRKKRAKVPMTSGLRRVLQAAKPHASCKHVIEWHGRPVLSIKTAFKKAAERAGLEDVSPHIMRHTAAVRMAAAGCPMERIAAYLGHSDPAVTRRVYAKFAPDHLRKEAKAVDLIHLLEAAAPPVVAVGMRDDRNVRNSRDNLQKVIAGKRRMRLRAKRTR